MSTGIPYTPRPVAAAQQADNALAKKLIEDGITAYQQGRYEEAVSQLTRARPLLPSHSPTALYLGLAYLKQNKTAEAIAAWQEYIKLQPYTEAERQANLPQTIPGYLTLLLREENQRVAREAILLEQQLGPGDPQTVAITYYRNLGSPELGALQKGLTALLISDVSKVQDLKVVERDLLQALLEELQLGATGAVDERTAPKVGRLLGAGKVATGSYLDATPGEVRVDSVLAESTTAQVINARQGSAQLQQFYALEKSVALALLADLGYDEPRLRAAGVWDTIRQPQTTSLVALTAYSRGLDAKDRGDYAAARTQFDQALVADPNFEEAEEERRRLPVVILPG
ncbi:MAG: tetratricopeptide repeat protein, partial [Candidatus Binatia bacterium]